MKLARKRLRKLGKVDGKFKPPQIASPKKKMHIYKFLEATSNTASGKAKNSTQDRGAELRGEKIL